MGETGCGKTRLIRFMCNLASQGSGQRNMLILKVYIVVCFHSMEFLEGMIMRERLSDNSSVRGQIVSRNCRCNQHFEFLVVQVLKRHQAIFMALPSVLGM